MRAHWIGSGTFHDALPREGRRWLPLLAALMLSACLMEEPTPTERVEIRQANFTAHLQYGYDPRTNLCFAFKADGSNAQTMTHVPCTPEVFSLIETP